MLPLVTVAEDATRIMSSVEYDPQTNRCVGFVLPFTGNGQVNNNAYTVTSFEDVERYFANNIVAKYAYVYMVQHMPSFCLACTTNLLMKMYAKRGTTFTIN